MNSTHQMFRYLPRGIFKYRFDFVHLLLSKVNYSEVNSPILLNARFSGEKRQICDLSQKLASFNNLQQLGKAK